MRELENRIRRATLVAAGETIAAFDLGLDDEAGAPLAPTLDGDSEAERQRVMRVLDDSGGVVARAADALGVSRQALYRTMTRLGIRLERRPT